MDHSERKHRVLIAFDGCGSQGDTILREGLKELLKVLELEKISSVYRVHGEDRSSEGLHDLRSVRSFNKLSFVLQALTSLKAESLVERFANLEQSLGAENVHRNLVLRLLVYDDLAVMTPQLTLPHPDLHKRPEDLILAAQVWGSYLHPVLNKRLREIATEVKPESWGSFFAQGKSLLDF